MSETGEIVYTLNDLDQIGYVNPAYDAFAAANQADRASSAGVLHRPLWKFIADLSTRHIYRELLQRVRSGRPVQFQFRCDSPTCRRLMEMRVSLGERGAVEFRCRTLSEEARPYQSLLDPSVPRAGEMLRACGWCKKIFVEGEWLEVEDAVERLRLFEHPAVPPLTHGICPACYQATMAALGLE